MENQESNLSICLEQPQHLDSESRTSLIREWLFRFALNCGETLTPERASGLVSLWTGGFSDVPPATLEAAFRKTIAGCKFWPKIADIREHLDHAQGSALEIEAAEKWETVRAYAVRRSPDYAERNPPRISEHTRRAINAAGGLDWIRDCGADDLTWARKRFCEAYVQYAELKQDEYLLPPGEVRNLLAEVAETKALPSSKTSFEELHAKGLAYSEELNAAGYSIPDIQRAIKAASSELAPRPPARSLSEQKQILREKGWL